MRTLLLTLAFLLAGPALAQPVAEIVTLEGNGDFREALQPAWTPAKAKQGLFPTNFVRTGDLSRMGLLFADRTQLRLAPNSVLQIKEAAKGPDAKTILNLNSGRSWVQSKSAPQGLVMETPSALAAIRGTDWEMAVDAEGRATLSVFSGEVDLSNDLGSVTVQRGEQARAEKGKAPVKLQLTVSRERMQWVSSVTIDPSRHRGPGADLLLQADIQVFQGDFGAATATLEKGRASFPGDARFAAGLSRVALLAGDSARALALACEAAGAHPTSVEAWLAVGDAARLEGLGTESAGAYRKAIDLAAGDARGWHGLGVVEGERGDLRPAREHLAKALGLLEAPGTAAELGTVETLASRHAEARTAFTRALELQPDHYVAWTGLGILQLRSGERAAAIESLLKAGIVEPRYSRAHVYLAAAYYQDGRLEAAREELRRAMETDPKDPLPHMLASMMRIDAIDFVGAAAAAQEALVRIPFLKSLDAIADNQRGIANVGAPLASLGLEDWARSAAHDSYLPSWGGSHLFLSDRYPGEFSRRSELMQGFVTDPLSFGASNRFQSLVPVPGHHATAALRYGHSNDFTVIEPALTANGMGFAAFPYAYFLEAVGTDVRRGNVDFDGDARTFTLGVGIKPLAELSLFAYASRLSADVTLGGEGVSGQLTRVDGSNERFDAGARYAFSPDHGVWVKAGASREDSNVPQLTTLQIANLALEKQTFFTTRPEMRDAALRYNGRLSRSFSLDAGVEGSRLETRNTFAGDSSLHEAGTPVAQEFLDQVDEDRYRSAYAIARWSEGALAAEVGATWRDYRKDRAAVVTRADGVVVPIEGGIHERGTDPMVGLVWKPAAAHTGRFAYREWLRPIALDGLAPVAVAGIPVEDQLVFPGGKLRQGGVQWEWKLSPTWFAAAHYEDVEVQNLVSTEGVLNTRTEVSNLQRLRNRVLNPPSLPDVLEEVPVFAAGKARRTHLGCEMILGPSLGARLHYTYADTRTTDTDPVFKDRHIPWIPRHLANVGLVWTPGWNAQVSAFAAWRSERFVDEANSTAVPPGWDARVNVFIESRDKRWAVEAYAYNLMKKETSDVFGVVASWRF